mmetsp:Transcript_32335/g.83922  ORF Transcript_32335/g.83922 Transcript_32335/m.83922 type:complete len:360 (-) Transcript_32335:1740-2819(-)
MLAGVLKRFAHHGILPPFLVIHIHDNRLARRISGHPRRHPRHLLRDKPHLIFGLVEAHDVLPLFVELHHGALAESHVFIVGACLVHAHAGSRGQASDGAPGEAQLGHREPRMQVRQIQVGRQQPRHIEAHHENRFFVKHNQATEEHPEDLLAGPVQIRLPVRHRVLRTLQRLLKLDQFGLPLFNLRLVLFHGTQIACLALAALLHFPFSSDAILRSLGDDGFAGLHGLTQLGQRLIDPLNLHQCFALDLPLSLHRNVKLAELFNALLGLFLFPQVLLARFFCLGQFLFGVVSSDHCLRELRPAPPLVLFVLFQRRRRCLQLLAQLVQGLLRHSELRLCPCTGLLALLHVRFPSLPGVVP